MPSVSRRRFIGATAVGLGALGFPNLVRQSWAAAGDDIVRDAISIDTHLHGKLSAGPSSAAQTYAAIMASPLTCGVFAVPADKPVLPSKGDSASGEDKIPVVMPAPNELYHHTFAALNNTKRDLVKAGFVIALSADDIRQAKQDNRKAAVLAIEGGGFAEGRLAAALEEAYDLGVRVVQPVHSRVNEFADVQTSPEEHAGFPDQGKQFVAEMNRLGMVLDLTHIHPASIKAALAASKTPVLMSHTYTLAKPAAEGSKITKRTIDSGSAKLIGDAGGVIGIWNSATPKQNNVGGYAQRITVTMIKAGGAKHIALGTDFGAISKAAMQNYGELPKLVSRLMLPDDSNLNIKGASVSDVRAILGENFLRLLESAAGARH